MTRRLLPIAALLAALLIPLGAATLERLSLDDMIDKSTAIVRGKVVASRATLHGPIIYTHLAVQVLERWKGTNAPQVEVVVPGGTAGGLHQTFSGAPKFNPNEEYVLFLWTGRSGLTHVIGLSQGVFSLTSDGSGGIVATRAASTEAMLDAKTGKVVTAESVKMKLGDLRSRVSGALAGGAK